MNGDDAARFWADFSFDISWIDIHRVRIYIDQDRRRSTVTNRVGSRDIRYRRNYYLISRLEVQCHQGQMKRGCPVIRCDGVFRTTEFGECILEGADILSVGGNPVGIETIEHVLTLIAGHLGLRNKNSIHLFALTINYQKPVPAHQLL